MKAETDQKWYSISVTVPPESAEPIEYAFNSLDALGTEINHLRKKNSESVTVVGYFNELPDEERFQDELHYALRAYGLTQEAVMQVERNEIENTDWLAEWKKHWKPSTVGEFTIAPPWSETAGADGIVIRIEPNMAFGTGTHETTQLCLEAIEKHYQPGDSFLDVGTGTGILAIAAAKLNLKSEISNLKGGFETSSFKSEVSNVKGGPGTSSFKSEVSNVKGGFETSSFKSQISNLKLSACDTDSDSITIAKENAQLNGVGGMIDFSVSSISDATPQYDFVCANLTLDVIEPLLPLLVEKANKTLVLSGILVEQRSAIVRKLSDLGIMTPHVNEAGEWLSVVIAVNRDR